MDLYILCLTIWVNRLRCPHHDNTLSTGGDRDRWASVRASVRVRASARATVRVRASVRATARVRENVRASARVRASAMG